MENNMNCGCTQNALTGPTAMQLAQAGFVIFDLLLYLDTHPTDQNALSYFAAKKSLYEQAKAAYVQQIGPVRISDVDPADGWTWGETPWPWEV